MYWFEKLDYISTWIRVPDARGPKGGASSLYVHSNTTRAEIEKERLGVFLSSVCNGTKNLF